MYYKPSYISEKGNRENNEDALAYKKINDFTACYIVCDGVGGEDRGEVASEMACNSIVSYFDHHPVMKPYEPYFESMIDFVLKDFDRYCSHNPDSKGMATTMAMLLFCQGQTIIVHLGDSRVYHIRGNELLFATEDHSVVNELLLNNMIAPEEVADHPYRHIITRAIHSDRCVSAKPGIDVIKEVKKGDSFFLCTDGILESVDTGALLDIIGAPGSDDSKLETIRKHCKKHSQDNYTAMLVTIEE